MERQKKEGWREMQYVEEAKECVERKRGFEIERSWPIILLECQEGEGEECLDRAEYHWQRSGCVEQVGENGEGGAER